MATLYITEFEALALDRVGGAAPVAMEPALAHQAVTFTTATASDAFDARTRYVRIVSDADCFVSFGDDPEATANDEFIVAGVPEWRGIRQGDGWKISAYDGSS